MYSLQEMLRPSTLVTLVAVFAVLLAMMAVMLVSRLTSFSRYSERWHCWYSPTGAKRGLRLAAAMLVLWCVWVAGFIRGSTDRGSPQEAAAALSATAATVPSASSMSSAAACRLRHLDI